LRRKSPPRRLKLAEPSQARKRPSPDKNLKPADFYEEQPMKKYKYHERRFKGLFFDEVRINPEDCMPGAWERFFERTKSRHHDPEMGIIEPVAVTHVYNRVRKFGKYLDRFDLIAVDRNDANAMVHTINTYGRALPTQSEHVALDGKRKEVFEDRNEQQGPSEMTNDQRPQPSNVPVNRLVIAVSPESTDNDEELGIIPSGSIDMNLEMKLLAEECDKDPYFTPSTTRIEKTEEEFEAEIQECLRMSEQDIDPETIACVDKTIAQLEYAESVDREIARMAESMPTSEPMEFDPPSPSSNTTSMEEVLKDTASKPRFGNLTNTTRPRGGRKKWTRALRWQINLT
jgi:hypothetical protein